MTGIIFDSTVWYLWRMAGSIAAYLNCAEIQTQHVSMAALAALDGVSTGNASHFDLDGAARQTIRQYEREILARLDVPAGELERLRRAFGQLNLAALQGGKGGFRPRSMGLLRAFRRAENKALVDKISTVSCLELVAELGHPLGGAGGDTQPAGDENRSLLEPLSLLERIGRNLTRLARQGLLHTIYDREKEIGLLMQGLNARE